MRNKIFAIFFSLLFVFMLIGAPTTLFLTEKGIIEYNNVGNEIEVDKTYDENEFLGSFFNGIEKGKLKIKDTYINNLPFFLEITNTYKPFKNDLNRPVMDWLQAQGNRLTENVCHHVYDEQYYEATCDGEGYTLKTCRLCSQSEKEITAVALGHRFEALQSIEATCENDGYTLYGCTTCSALEQRDIVEAVGHSYEMLSQTSPTCTENGSIGYICTACDSAYIEELSAVGHVYVDTVVAEKDGVAGYTLHECANCDYSYKDNFQISEDHVHSFVESKIEATCEKEGGTRKVCAVCGYTEDSDITAPLGHSYSKSVIEPTCDGSGYDLYTCQTCQSVYRENSVAPLGHKYSSSIVAPTCDENGYTKNVCSVCRDEKITNVVAKKEHSYKLETVAPTYTEKGYDLYTCTACSASYKDNEVPMLVSTIPTPKTTPDADGTTYTSSLVMTDNIFRHYELTAKYPDGTMKTSYSRIVKLDRDTLYSNMLDITNLVNTMVEKNRDVNWYFSFATNIEATEIGEKIVPQESTRYIYEDFLTKLDKSVKVSALEVNSFNDYYDKFYITDHHWNHHGSEEAYLEIVRMLSENYPEVKPIEVNELCEFDDVKFYGSLARAQANYEVSDIFGVYFRQLPYHNVDRDAAISYGSTKAHDANLKIYKDGKFNTAQGYNHYTEFYRVCERIKYPKNETGRKLLIIGDSYSLPLLELVAAHFDETFIRYEDRSWKNFPEELLYDEFVEEKGITDVIVIEEMAKCIMQGYGDAYPSGFLNIFPDENW